MRSYIKYNEKNQFMYHIVFLMDSPSAVCGKASHSPRLIWTRLEQSGQIDWQRVKMMWKSRFAKYYKKKCKKKKIIDAETRVSMSEIVPGIQFPLVCAIQLK